MFLHFSLPASAVVNWSRGSATDAGGAPGGAWWRRCCPGGGERGPPAAPASLAAAAAGGWTSSSVIRVAGEGRPLPAGGLSTGVLVDGRRPWRTTTDDLQPHWMAPDASWWLWTEDVAGRGWGRPVPAWPSSVGPGGWRRPHGYTHPGHPNLTKKINLISK